MNRKIKFRAYNQKDNVIHYDITGFEFDNKGNLTGIFINGDFVEIENIELMQYTGLHDKNGKEIYEGDIVNINLLDVNLLNIKGLVQYKEKYAQFVIVGTRTVAHECEELGDYIDYEIEVIGNIYENKELLEA